ncbi:hypothetical protein [Paraglaciecola chathamensis]|uniref:hypothetical protein n=1 Tax=Paraglaciecola chathamensis TaxID=368405 RepID=UPI002701857B|nr:hypothetical protein [Paraglaciecola chathamensis]MDO6559411.1 hypothetical protein [Paraglaciecola chathamensis]
MRNTNKAPSQFTKVYKRESKSPFDDHCTMLWLASATCSAENNLDLGYERYIYVHKDNAGKVVGISISKQLLEENPEFESRYLNDITMYAFLLLYVEEIAAFCEFFKEEFTDMFLIPPADYFAISEQYWLEKISNA